MAKTLEESNQATAVPSQDTLLKIIEIQAEIAKFGLDLGGVMQYVVEQVLPLIGANGAAIEMAESGEMVYRAAAGIAANQLGLRLAMHSSLSGLCVMTGEMLICEDSESDPRVDRIACSQVGLRSMCILPLNHKGLTVGVLKAMSVRPSHFSPQDAHVLALMSEAVAASMYFSAKYDTDSLFLMATRDELTGLANRALFMDRLRGVISRAQREQDSAGLLMIDMDGLKRINDRHGHRFGDAVLVEFSSRLKKATRNTDTVARLGGDEFAVILSPLDTNGVTPALDRIDSAIRPALSLGDMQLQMRASIGSVLIPAEGSNPDDVIELADRRMYAIKKSRATVT